jgi:hypothetical protein
MSHVNTTEVSLFESYQIVRFLADELDERWGGCYPALAARAGWRHGCRALFCYDPARAQSLLKRSNFGSFTQAAPGAGGDSLRLCAIGGTGIWENRGSFSFAGSRLEHGAGELKVWAAEAKTAQQVLGEIMLELQLRPPDRISHARFGHIYWERRDECAVAWEFPPVKPTDFGYELGRHYGPGVADWVGDRIAAFGMNQSDGITFISGGIGTGKTRLLRRLGLDMAKSHAMLAISADDLLRIRSPLEFWSTVYPGGAPALIAVEDADRCLKDSRRGARLHQLLSRMGYGWMAAQLRHRLICTLNAETPAEALELLPTRWHPYQWRHLERWAS